MHGERTALTPWAREAKPARQSKMPGNGRLLSPGAYGLFVKWWVRFGVNVFMNTTIEFTSDQFDLSTQKTRENEWQCVHAQKTCGTDLLVWHHPSKL